MMTKWYLYGLLIAVLTFPSLTLIINRTFVLFIINHASPEAGQEGHATILKTQLQAKGLGEVHVIETSFQDTGMFAVKSSHHPTALYIISAISLLANIALIIFHIYPIRKNKRNPFTQEVYIDEAAYAKLALRKEE